jgi:hypothetical protein
MGWMRVIWIINLKFQGGSPCLCRLRPALIGPIEQAFEMYGRIWDIWILKLGSFVCSGHPRCVQRGIRVEDGTRVR